MTINPPQRVQLPPPVGEVECEGLSGFPFGSTGILEHNDIALQSAPYKSSFSLAEIPPMHSCHPPLLDREDRPLRGEGSDPSGIVDVRRHLARSVQRTVGLRGHSNAPRFWCCLTTGSPASYGLGVAIHQFCSHFDRMSLYTSQAKNSTPISAHAMDITSC